MKEWFGIAFEASTVCRALKYAVIVGAVLITINHGDAILNGDVGRMRLLKMALTVTVPYLVSTFSSVGALRQVRRSTCSSSD